MGTDILCMWASARNQILDLCSVSSYILDDNAKYNYCLSKHDTHEYNEIYFNAALNKKYGEQGRKIYKEIIFYSRNITIQVYDTQK